MRTTLQFRQHQPKNTMELIGPAGRLAARLLPTLRQQRNIKLLFCGPPGVGKTTLAETIAFALCGNKFGLESENGRNVTIHVVRDWMADVGTSSLFGSGWKVKLVNEVDVMPRDAQDALLSFLDELPPRRAFIATSNLQLDALTERFRTRLQRIEVGAPAPAEIAEFLSARCLPKEVASHFAELCAGNVRAACLDSAAWHQKQTGKLAVLAQQFQLHV